MSITWKFPLYSSLRAVKPAALLDLDELAAAMRAGSLGNISFRRDKARLPVAVFAAQPLADARSKSEDQFEFATGLAAIDLDDLGSPAAAADLLAVAQTSPHTALAFISPSGAGVKVVGVLADRPELRAEYLGAWEQLAAYYAELTGLPMLTPAAAAEQGKPPHLDRSGSNLNRLCFIPAVDPYLAADPIPFPWVRTVREVAWEVGVADSPGVEVVRPAPPGAPLTRRPEPEIAAARRALAGIPPPVDGAGCYLLLRDVCWAGVAAGLTAADLLAWAGDYHRAGEIPAIMAAHRPGGVGVGTLFRRARQHGYLRGAGDAEPEWTPEFDADRLRVGFADGSIGTWTMVGEWLALTPLAEGWRYDSRQLAWFEWIDSSHWMPWAGRAPLPYPLAKRIQDCYPTLRPLLDLLSVAGLDKKGRPAPELVLDRRTLAAELRGGIMLGLMAGLDRPFPDYPNDESAAAERSRFVAVPSGVVDLETGTMVAHDAAIHDTTAVFNGDYRPADVDYLEGVLAARMLRCLTLENYARFKQLLGIAFADRGQTWRAIWIFLGEPRSGKSGTGKLLTKALGARGKNMSTDFLESRPRGIDAGLYDLMRTQPLVVFIDDLDANVRIHEGKLKTLTGDVSLPGARLPYQPKEYSDTVPSVVVLTAVEPPAMGRGSGLDERLFVLEFCGQFAGGDGDLTRRYPRDLLDAVVTVGVVGAGEALQAGYRYPDFDLAAQGRALADMDPIQDFLDNLEGVWHGRLVSDALAFYRECSGDDSVTATLFGRRIGLSKVWRKEKATIGEHTFKQCLWLRHRD